ncbi:MAG TPA: TonB-dependent receptor plug domain-containing protein [Sphingomicrobium sp.]|nr:TonB-dependent receptor plug domain-containing protein [Sphingomicrobium sp.]
MTRFTPRVNAVLISTACFWVVPDVASAQSADPAVAPPPVAVETAGKRIYTAADFARFAPRNALDMLRQVPGFIIREAVQERGLGQASENVLLNGQRVSNKSGGAIGELEKIPASNVERIEIVDAATLDIAGLTGQVANVVTKAEKKASGQFAWRPEFRAHYADPLFTRGEISYSGSTGPVDYTLGLNSNGNRSAAGGPTTIFSPAGEVTELRDDAWRGNWNAPGLSGRFTLDGPDSSVGNLNLAYERNYFNYYEDSIRERPGDIDRLRSVRLRKRGFEYEIGGDYDFALGPGRLKLIGLRSHDYEPLVSTAIVDFSDGSPSVGDRVVRDGRESEWIGRGEYSWKTGQSDWQVSAEAAFNSLNSVTEIFALQPDGEFEEIPFPAGTGQVQEDRFEILGTYGRPLGEAVTLQLVAGGEYSKLSSQSAGNSLTRSFFRPKGSAALAWKANSGLDVSLRVRRRVEQLNFYDFLASVNLTEDRQNAGNLELVPPQVWEVDLEANKKLGSWGNTSLRPFGRLIDDIVDIIPIGLTGQSPGNIDRAHRYGFEWKGTWLFDNLGWTGAKLDSVVVLQRSQVRDPLTGEKRPISGSLQRQVELNLRHDVPGTSWAWGGSLAHYHAAKVFRLTEVGRMSEGPVWLGVFVEHKDVMGLTVRASVSNILNARSRWDRDVYAGFRDTSPLLFLERRNRLIGPIFSFSVRGNF